MKKMLLLSAAVLASGIALAQGPLDQYAPGFRTIDGSQLNKMVNIVNNLTNYSYQLVTAGSEFYTYTIPNSIGVVVFDIASGPISDERVTAPPNPYDGQQVTINSRVTITSFQFIANTGQTLAATTPTVLTASTTAPQGYKWIYRGSDKKWYRLQ